MQISQEFDIPISNRFWMQNYRNLIYHINRAIEKLDGFDGKMRFFEAINGILYEKILVIRNKSTYDLVCIAFDTDGSITILSNGMDRNEVEHIVRTCEHATSN